MVHANQPSRSRVSPMNASRHTWLLTNAANLRAASAMGAFLFLPLSIAATSICLALLVCALLLEIMATGQWPPLADTALKRALLAFFAVTFLLTPFAVNVRQSLFGLSNLADMAVFFPLYLACADRAALKRMLSFFMAGVLMVAVYGVMQHYLEVDIFRLSRPFSFLKHLNDDLTAPVRISGFSSYMTLAGQLSMAIPLMTASLLAQRERAKKIGWLAAMLLGSVALMWTFTRSAWLGAMLGIIVVGTLHLGKKFLLPILALLLLLAGSVFVQQQRQKEREEFVERYQQQFAGNAAPTSMMPPTPPAALLPPESSELRDRLISMFSTKDNRERLYTWQSALAMIADYPFAGIGHGNYSDLCPQYRAAYPITFTSDAHAHNNLLQVAVVGGIPLFISFLWLWGAMFRATYQAYRRALKSDLDLQAITLGACGALIAFFMQGLFEYNWGDSEVVMLLWGLLACAVRAGEFAAAELA